MKDAKFVNATQKAISDRTTQALNSVLGSGNSSNVASTLVKRDSSGGFAAGIITIDGSILGSGSSLGKISFSTVSDYGAWAGRNSAGTAFRTDRRFGWDGTNQRWKFESTPYVGSYAVVLDNDPRFSSVISHTHVATDISDSTSIGRAILTAADAGTVRSTIGLGSPLAADTATRLATPRTVALTGAVTGSGSFDGSANLSIATTAVAAGTWLNAAMFAYAGTPVGDKTSRPLSTLFGSLSAAQAVFPHATALTNEHDWAVLQAGINAAVTAGGATLYIPPGVYMMTSSADAAAGTAAGTLYLPQTKTVDYAFSALGASVNLVGAGQNQTSLYWPSDLGSNRFAVLCKDKYTTGILGAGDRQIDLDANYQEVISDLSLIGPGFTSLGNAYRPAYFRPPCAMHGLGWGNGLEVERVRIAGFYSGLNIVGGQSYFIGLRLDSNYYGIYFDRPSRKLYGNFDFTKVWCTANIAAGMATSNSGGIGGSAFSQCFFGESPYGILKEHRELLVPWKASWFFYTGMYCEKGGNIYRCTAPNTGGTSGATGPSGTGGSISDGSVTWAYVATSNYATGTTFAAGAVVKRNRQYYLSLQTADQNTGNGGSPGPVGRGATITDGIGFGTGGTPNTPHVWRWLGHETWKPSTAYAVGDVVQNWTAGTNLPNGSAAKPDQPGYYRCVTAGTSGSSGSGPNWGVSYDGSTPPSDGTVVWVFDGSNNLTFATYNTHHVTQFEHITLGAMWDENITVGHDYDTWSWITNEHHLNTQFAWGSYDSFFALRKRTSVYAAGYVADLRISNATENGLMTYGGTSTSGSTNLTLAKTTIKDYASIFMFRMVGDGGINFDGDVTSIINATEYYKTLFHRSFQIYGATHKVAFNQNRELSGNLETIDFLFSGSVGDVMEAWPRYSDQTQYVRPVQVAEPTNSRVVGICMVPGLPGVAVPVATQGASIKVKINQRVTLGGYWVRKDTAGAAYSKNGAATYATGPTDNYVIGWLRKVDLGRAYVCTVAGTTSTLGSSGPIVASGTVTDGTVTWKAAIPWTASSTVVANDLRTKSGILYKCTTGGTTGSTGPTGTGTNLADGATVKWSSISIVGPWVTGQTYAVGDHIVTPVGDVYRCAVAGVADDTAANKPPTGTTNGIVDGTGTLRWDYAPGGNTWLTPWEAGVTKSVGDVVWNGGYGYVTLSGLA